MPQHNSLPTLDLSSLSLQELHMLVERLEKAIEVKLFERGMQRALDLFAAQKPTTPERTATNERGDARRGERSARPNNHRRR
ncbi:hypothetical protein [Plasticicumulans acidivorans]|uniref:Uncharacterized protein n=1 Tax=Plasticicumulans acidivorans TaxID=886464 RepID=A0A317N1L3_9GAMM|nr:hypothetical protein [Plasticicumulans acidivorans]PWV65798.1 hypothetical protein C7443_101283 [Plasticicumulans acidivorans]